MSPVLRCLSDEEGLEGELAGGGERGGSDIDSAAGRWLNGEKLRGDRGLCCILFSTSWRRAGAISGGFSITVIRPVRRRRGESGNDGGTRPLPPITQNAKINLLHEKGNLAVSPGLSAVGGANTVTPNISSSPL